MPLEEYDGTYASYFLRCLDLVKRIELRQVITLNPRHLDNYLLGFDKIGVGKLV